MRAVVIVPGSERGHLDLQEVPAPALEPGTVRIAVRAAGVNHADLAQRDGRYAQHATHRGTGGRIAGLEVAGTVIEVAADVEGVACGDAVMTMCAGGYAEQVVVDHRLVLPKPGWLDWRQAAAFPVGFVTAHNALTDAGRLAAGEAVLITGASSVVGTAAGQLAKRLGAGRVIGTTGSPAKAEALRALGFDDTILHTGRPLAEALEALGGADVVIDLIAGDWLPPLLDALKIRGRLVSVGRLRGRNVSFNLDTVARKRLEIIGVSFRSRSLEEYARVVRRAAADILGPLERRELVLPPVRAFALVDAAAAQDALESGGFAGKIVIDVMSDVASEPGMAGSGGQ